MPILPVLAVQPAPSPIQAARFGSFAMNKRVVLAMTLCIGLVAIAGPIFAAIYIANDQAVKAETARAMGFAADAVRRTDMASDEMEVGIARLVEADASEPCSTENIALMRGIDLASTYIQAVAHMVGNRIVCSSLDAADDGLDIGPPDFVQPSGAVLRTNVEFPFARGTSFVVVERDGYAAVIHKARPIDVTAGDPDTAVAVVTEPGGRVLVSQGDIRPEWIARLAGQREVSFVDDGTIVAGVASNNRYIGAVAALPALHLEQRIWSTAIYLVPLGVMAGLVLDLAVIYLARTQLSMPAAIKSGLRRDEFFLRYQPVADIETGAWVGAEALLRWSRHGKEVSPEEFIPAAEDAGLIKLVSARVIKLVGQDAVDLFRRYPEFHLSINLSSADLNDAKTVGLMKALAETTGARPGSLTVEATERRVIDAKSSRDIVQKLRADGVQIAIDDFGTGYSSLSYLRDLDFDCVKIDKSFVDTLGTGGATSQVVAHIIEMAKSLNLLTVAEGVETQEQADLLSRLGVRYAQGWFFAAPMSFSGMAAQLRLRGVQRSDAVAAALATS